MITALFRWWRKRQRNIDIDVLWPACREQARNIEQARAAFLFHCARDTAWTKDFTHLQIMHMVDRLR